MFIPSVIKRCVAFIGIEGIQKDELIATTFFVGVHSPLSPKYRMNYLVTAKHVIEDIKSVSNRGKMHIRMNWQGKGAVPVPFKCSDWLYHPTDKDVDVAVMPVTPHKRWEWGQIPSEMFLTDEISQRSQIGMGDDIFIVGLFTNHYGNKRNIPIARIGNIAAMPEEPLSLVREIGKQKVPYNMDAYLIEARSIGGLSGSPVFVEEPILGGGIMARQAGRHSKHFLLGLVHGHWDSPYPKQDSMVKGSREGETVNMGIGMVVPAKSIMEVLKQPELSKALDKAVTRLLDENAPEQDVQFD